MIKTKKGYVTWHRDEFEDSEMVIEMIYVEPEYRGRGIGGKLLKRAIEKISNLKNIDKISLFAYPQDDNSLDEDKLISWYEDFGFESDGDCDGLMSKAV